MTEKKTVQKSTKALPQEYIDSIWGIWQSTIEMYEASPVKRMDFWKVTSILRFFIRQGLAVESLIKKNQEILDKVNEGSLDPDIANMFAKRIEWQLRNQEGNKVFYKLFDSLREDYERILEHHTQYETSLDSDVMTYQTFDEIVEEMKKPKATLNKKSAIAQLEANKFEALNDL